MSEVQELNDAVKQLQSADTAQDFLSTLTVLKQRKHVTEAILRETKVGLAVGKLRMHKAKAVANLAKEIVSQWKRAVEKAKLKGSNHKADSDSGLYSDKKASVTPDAPADASASCRSAKADGVTFLTGDKTRDRCVQLIYDGLVHDSAFSVELVSEKAHEAEKIVYENMGGLTNDYKAKIASLFINVSDKNHPGLGASIVEGVVSPEKFVEMTRVVPSKVMQSLVKSGRRRPR